jgi:triosephosphate isomerase
MRRLFIAGNWKMFTNKTEAESLIRELKLNLSGVKNVDIAICPPFVYLERAVSEVKGSIIQVGAQNCYLESKGAFTGEISPDMLVDAGCKFVILGHSERRHVLGETDIMINQKTIKALQAGLHIILCVGELLEEREAGKTETIVKNQLHEGLKNLNMDHLDRITIAYEPVWAIGTGKTATPDQAQEIHAFIRGWLRNRFSDDAANQCRIQYGGSVKPENAKELMTQPDIDGALVGGASLKADSFTAIIKAAI